MNPASRSNVGKGSERNVLIGACHVACGENGGNALKQDDFNKIPELQVCIAEALYDIESILSDPGGYPYKEIVKLRDQIVSNLERAWEISGGDEDQLSGTMLQISQVVGREFKMGK